MGQVVGLQFLVPPPPPLPGVQAWALQASAPVQATHATPSVPQVALESPGTHVLVSSQQPLQVAGPHFEEAQPAKQTTIVAWKQSANVSADALKFIAMPHLGSAIPEAIES